MGFVDNKKISPFIESFIGLDPLSRLYSMRQCLELYRIMWIPKLLSAVRDGY